MNGEMYHDSFDNYRSKALCKQVLICIIRPDELHYSIVLTIYCTVSL
jgi:hypothetical protein